MLTVPSVLLSIVSPFCNLRSVVIPVESKLIPVPIVSLFVVPTVIAFVKVEPPEFVILKPSVTAVVPIPVVSAWSSNNKASVVESVKEFTKAFEIAIAYWVWAIAPWFLKL